MTTVPPILAKSTFIWRACPGQGTKLYQSMTARIVALVVSLGGACDPALANEIRVKLSERLHSNQVNSNFR